jgi:hypothetical protein
VEKGVNEEIHNLCLSSNIIRLINIKEVRWLRHVACRRDGKYKHFLGSVTERDNSEDLGVDGRKK